MSGLEVPRPDLEAALLSRAKSAAPLLLTGPPGSGKTTLLQALARRLELEGWVAVYLDLMGAVSAPERFVAAALHVLPAEAFGRRLQQATEIRRLADAGRQNAAAAVQGLLRLWASLDEAGGRPVALLLDEVTEIRSLAYFAGLREVHQPFAGALAARRRGTVLATSFATAARKLWAFETLEARPLSAADLAGLHPDPGGLARGACGWPRYVRILLEAADGGDLAVAWAREMAPGGRLEAACRHTYESLLLRSRGYGISKAALQAVALEEGLNLTALVARIGRTPGAVRDYLQWLVGVDAIRMAKKRYHYVDGQLARWVRLHGRGWPPTPEELRRAASEAVLGETPAAAEDAPAAGPTAPERRDSLIEID